MKTTGIVRRIDELGRVVIPKEIRKILNIKENDRIDISVEDERIIIKKFNEACALCNNEEETVDFLGKKLCYACIAQIKDMH